MQTDDNQALHVMADGGVLSNYPLFLFDSTKYLSTDSLTANAHIENPETLGLLMEMPEQIAYNDSMPGNYPLPVHSVYDYLRALYHTLIDKANPEANHLYTLHRTITINNLNLSGRVRKLPKQTVLV